MKKNKLYLKILFYLYTFLFSIFFLIEPIRSIFLKESSLTLQNDYLFIIISILLLLFLFLNYILFKFLFKNNEFISFKELFIYSIIINFLLFLIWPITSTDIFSYIYQARVWVIFKESSYLLAYSNFYLDYYYYLIGNSWSNYTSPYGPLFLIIKGFFVYIFTNNIFLNIYSVKLFFIIINILNGFLIYKITKNKLAFYLYAFNPLIIFEFAINAHNEVLLIFFFLLALSFLNYKKNIKKDIIIFTLLCLSVFIKFITAIFLPLYLLLVFLKKRKFLNNILLILLFIFLFLSLAALLYYPFINSYLDIFLPIINQSSNITPFSSPLIVIIYYFSSFLNINLASNIIVLISRFIFIILYLFIVLNIIKYRNNNKYNYLIKFIYLSGIALLIFLLTFFGWILPWYFTFLISIFSLIYGLIPEKRDFSLFIIYFSSIYAIIQYILLR